MMYWLFSKLGGLVPRFGTVVQTLEQLEKEIKDYEKYKQKNELNERKYIGALVLYSIVLYILGAVIYYIYLMPKNIVDRLKTSIPFFITPLIIYALRRFLKWYFIKRSTYYEKKLFNLKEEKKQILEDVKENETYKKAREILERFSSQIDITPPDTPMRSPATPYVNTNGAIVANNKMQMPGANLVHRNVKQLQNQSLINGSNNQSQSQLNLTKSTPNMNETNKLTRSASQTDNSVMNASTASSTSQQPQHHLSKSQMGDQSMLPPPPPSAMAAQARTLLPRPIVAPNRTYFDKLLDFLVGEGPNNRYALICKNCHFHNGMALKEEFEYVAFRCAYCLFYNEARKTKLSVPKLQQSTLNTIKPNNDNDNETMSNSNINNMMKHDKLTDSLDSSLASSNSLDDIGTVSEPITSSTKMIASSNQQANEPVDNEPVEKRRRHTHSNDPTAESITTAKSISREKLNDKKEI